MKQFLLLFIFVFISLYSEAQSDTIAIYSEGSKSPLMEMNGGDLIIYPVPVRENTFSIRSRKDISSVRVSNIIGQQVFAVKYNNPVSFIKINLDNPERGIYLIAAEFTDRTRIIRKIMIESTD
jgi:hypothetical protein